MAKTTIKTQPTPVAVTDYIATLTDATQQADCMTLMQIMSEVTGESPQMWGPAIVGYRTIHLKYESGREMDFFKVGFSPRKGKLALYLMGVSFDDARQRSIFDRLGTHTHSKSCLYVKRLADVDLAVLRELITTVNSTKASLEA